MAQKTEKELSLKTPYVLYGIIHEEFESLKKCDKYLKIEISLHESEAEIEAFRKYNNDIITDYNKMVRSFPTNFVAKVCGYKIRTYYDGKNTEDEITNDFKL